MFCPRGPLLELLRYPFPWRKLGSTTTNKWNPLLCRYRSSCDVIDVTINNLILLPHFLTKALAFITIFSWEWFYNKMYFITCSLSYISESNCIFFLFSLPLVLLYYFLEWRYFFLMKIFRSPRTAAISVKIFN